MSYGHKHGRLQIVTEVLSDWSHKGTGRVYRRKVRLTCGHVVAQTGNNIRGENRFCRCHICRMQTPIPGPFPDPIPAFPTPIPGPSPISYRGRE